MHRAARDLTGAFSHECWVGWALRGASTFRRASLKRAWDLNTSLAPSLFSMHLPPRGTYPSGIGIDTPVGRGFQVTTDNFLQCLLPPLPESTDLDALIDTRLRTGGSFAPITIHGRLRGYNKKNPSGIHSKDEMKAFAHLQRGFNEFAHATDRDQWLAFCNNPAAVPNHAKRTEGTLPDAYFTLASVGDKPEWKDIIVPGEYKRVDSAAAAQEVPILKLYKSSVSPIRPAEH